LRREAGAVDLERFELGLLEAECLQRLVVALDQMRLLDRQQAPVDQLVVAQEVHGHRLIAPAGPKRPPRSAPRREASCRTSPVAGACGEQVRDTGRRTRSADGYRLALPP